MGRPKKTNQTPQKSMTFTLPQTLYDKLKATRFFTMANSESEGLRSVIREVLRLEGMKRKRAS